MTKQPTLKVVDDGWYEASDLNYNFNSIAAAFENALWRTAADGESYPTNPNFMDVDLDVADANITNVRQLDITSIEVANQAFTGFGTQYLWKLGQLSCASGAMITHNSDGDPVCLPKGTDGQVLKTSSAYPTWSEDIDTDTVGVTIQEDGVTIAENVTTIDFKWTNVTYPTLVTTPASNQVDIALDDVYLSTITAIWEDTRATNDLNINPDGPSSSVFNNVAEVVRLDLVNDVGISIPSSDNEYYFIMESSSWLETSNQSPGTASATGTWGHAIRFYDNTGTSTALTGVLIPRPAGETSNRGTTTPGGALQTVYCGIPAGTRYVDVGKADAFTFPLNINHAVVDNRYRAVVSALAKNAGFTSPNGIAWPGGINTRVTPDPSP